MLNLAIQAKERRRLQNKRVIRWAQQLAATLGITCGLFHLSPIMDTRVSANTSQDKAKT